MVYGLVENIYAIGTGFFDFASFHGVDKILHMAVSAE